MQNVPLHVLAITHLMNTYSEQHTKNLRISLNITVKGFCRAKFLAEEFLQTHPGAVVKNATTSSLVGIQLDFSQLLLVKSEN